MTATTTNVSPAGNWFTRLEAELDARGKGAWIALTVLGFVFAGPLGLALLAYAIWSKRIFSKGSCGHSTRHTLKTAIRPSGNRAFDAYKLDTLRRLEDEQIAFDEFLERLRESKDKTEFDNFMDERASEEPEQDDAKSAR